MTPLEVEGVAVHFGGITALNGASAKVEPGEIVGLIGPNGAGKTTLMNVISGFLRPDAGSVRLFGTEVASSPPQVRAELGVARSFQDATLFPGLTVLETVQIALGHRTGSRLLPAMAGAPWVRAAENESRRQALGIVRSFGLESWEQSLTVELSTGMKRICDLMVQLAAGPRLLLLDEPTAGVAQREAESFGPLVRSIRETLGCAILIIEHDMPLLMGLCDRVYALEAGQVIAEGTPEQVRNDPAVIASYLGTNARATNRSDTARPMLSFERSIETGRISMISSRVATHRSHRPARQGTVVLILATSLVALAACWAIPATGATPAKSSAAVATSAAVTKCPHGTAAGVTSKQITVAATVIDISGGSLNNATYGVPSVAEPGV